MKPQKHSIQEVYQRSGEAMDLLLKAAPKMLEKEQHLFNGKEIHGPKKERKQAA